MAFYSEKLFYRTIYLGIKPSALRKLQLVQNPVPLPFGNKGYHRHIINILHSVHWFPIEYQMKFKVLVIIFKTLNGLESNISKTLNKHQQENCSRLLCLSSKMELSILRIKLMCEGYTSLVGC